MSKQAIQAAKQRKRWLLLPAIMAVALAVIGGNYLASGDAQASAKPGTVAGLTATEQAPSGPIQASHVPNPDIFHLTPFGGGAGDHIANNLIGYMHQVCARDLTVDGIWPAFGTAGGLNWKIVDANNNGDPNVLGDTTNTNTNCSGDGDQWPDSLLTYYSSTPGEQFITLVNDAGSLMYDAGGAVDAPEYVPAPLIKEWNVLEPTVIRTGTSETSTDVTDGSATQGVVWDDYREEYVSITSTVIYEHVHGSHNDGSPGGWHGEIIGAQVTIIAGGTCGVVQIDGPLLANGNPDFAIGTQYLNPGQSITLISTGVPFKISIFANNCYNGNGDYTTVTIMTAYDNDLGSTQPGGDTETYRVDYVATPPTNKQPLLAWAGQRVVLEHDWHSPDNECRWRSIDEVLTNGDGEDEEFIVQYVKQNGPGSFTSGVWGDVYEEDTQIEANNAWVLVDDGDEGDDDSDSSEGCISRVIYESQDPGEVDVVAFVVNCMNISIEDGCDDSDDEDPGAISQQVPFLIYFMKIEDVKVGIVPGTFNAHNNGSDKGAVFSNANPWNTATDVTSQTSNVSADVLIRARVRGWFVNSNPSGRAAIPGNPDLGLDGRPADRWIMPDDWRTLAGGVLAEEFRPNYDIMFAPDSGFACTTTSSTGVVSLTPESCLSAVGQGINAVKTLPGIRHSYVQGPFSLLDDATPFLGSTTTFAPSHAPRNDGSGDNDNTRNTILPDGRVDRWDAPMPPALMTFRLTGSGFLVAAPKANVYSAGTNAFYTSNIPAEPGIRKLNSDGSGYLISSWDLGTPYAFWSAVKTGSAVYSAAGADAAKTTASASKVATGGWTQIGVYSDNHGESMVIVNGDAGLTLSGCSDAASKTNNGIVSLTGAFCEKNDAVGSSTVNAVADYPDKRKHAPVLSNDVTVNWTWGGIKQVDIVDGEAPLFKYIVFTVTDRDGFCTVPAGATSLHPVNGEAPDFAIDAGEGRIILTSNGAPTSRSTALGVPVYDTAATGEARDKGSAVGCQAWIKVSNSLLGVLNVLIIAYDPEGTVTFDRIVDFNTTASYNLTFRWSLVTWTGANNMAVADALGSAAAQVTAVYGWKQATQEWLGWFPGTAAPGAIDLTALTNGAAYWVAIDGDPASVLWTWTTNVN